MRPMTNPDATYALYYKGRYQMTGSATDIAAFVHAHTNHSLNHALKHEGWSIRPVGVKKNPCGLNMKHARRTAQANANYFGVPYVVFSDTSGNLRIERASIGPKNVPWKETFKPIRDRFARHNPELPGAPAVESISVEDGGQPQKALMASGWKVSKVEGGKATMVKANLGRDEHRLRAEFARQDMLYASETLRDPMKAEFYRGKRVAHITSARKTMRSNPASRRPRVGAVVRLADGEVVRLIQREKDGNWLVKLLSSYREKIVSRGLCGAKVVANPSPLPDPFTVNRETYFDVADGLYWFAMQHHGGQASTLYAVGSSLGFEPSRLAKGPEEGLPREVYRALHKLWKKSPNTVDRMAEIMARQIKQVMKYKDNPGPEADPTAFRAAVRKAAVLAQERGERVFLVFDASVGKYEILLHSPTWGRFWEVTTSGGHIAHNPRRPTKAFMARCMKGVGPGYSPGAVCASTWHKMSAAAKRKWMALENPGAPSEWQPHYGKVVWRKGDWSVVEQKGFSYGTPFTVYYKGEQAGMNYGSFAQAKFYAQQMSNSPSGNPNRTWHADRIDEYMKDYMNSKFDGSPKTKVERLAGMVDAESRALYRGDYSSNPQGGRAAQFWHLARLKEQELPRALAAARWAMPFSPARKYLSDVKSAIRFYERKLGVKSNPGRYGGTPMYRRYKSSARYSVKCPDCGVTVKRRLEDIPDDKRCAICSAKRRRLGSNPSPRYKVIGEHDDHYYTRWHFVGKREAIAQARKCADDSRGYHMIKVVVVTHPGDQPVLKLYRDGRQWKECKG